MIPAGVTGRSRDGLACGSHPSREDRTAAGAKIRAGEAPDVLGAWSPQPDRADPIALLEGQATTRLPDLVPVRYGRMSVSPFTFYRGAALPMAADLAAGPSSGITVQLCGDAHVSNFGLFASPERDLLFDINDFDETLPGPFEFDLKRLAASLVVAGRELGVAGHDARHLVRRAIRSYPERMAGYADHAGDRRVLRARRRHGDPRLCGQAVARDARGYGQVDGTPRRRP